MRPDYKTHDPRGWMGDSKRGAALGRADVRRGSPVGRLYLRQIRLNMDGYDTNGTYFGHGGKLYWYADAGGNVDGVLRADSREEARAKVVERFPTWAEALPRSYILVLQGDYGNGWEDLTAEDRSAPEAWRLIRQSLRKYRENEGGTYRIVTRRE